ncbi:hypothetical protein BRADI_1g48325v3 [Brachypodium distachyon]|uniref:Uncharacterized protein n=1 Tax=Brachypodium distachyon TaxID=15368 RepID=A0A2K2DQ97_BRADI|nr:hypothetical protein BRADI_1g48325v3 [Brachypodium distachyon]
MLRRRSIGHTKRKSDASTSVGEHLRGNSVTADQVLSLLSGSTYTRMIEETRRAIVLVVVCTPNNVACL